MECMFAIKAAQRSICHFKLSGNSYRNRDEVIFRMLWNLPFDFPHYFLESVNCLWNGVHCSSTSLIVGVSGVIRSCHRTPPRQEPAETADSRSSMTRPTVSKWIFNCNWNRYFNMKDFLLCCSNVSPGDNGGTSRINWYFKPLTRFQNILLF